MKSMSWLLYEDDCTVQECSGCGFLTRSPSIYRRHKRICIIPERKAVSDIESAATVGNSDCLDFPRRKLVAVKNTEKGGEHELVTPFGTLNFPANTLVDENMENPTLTVPIAACITPAVTLENSNLLFPEEKLAADRNVDKPSSPAAVAACDIAITSVGNSDHQLAADPGLEKPSELLSLMDSDVIASDLSEHDPSNLLLPDSSSAAPAPFSTDILRESFIPKISELATMFDSTGVLGPGFGPGFEDEDVDFGFEDQPDGTVSGRRALDAGPMAVNHYHIMEKTIDSVNCVSKSESHTVCAISSAVIDEPDKLAGRDDKNIPNSISKSDCILPTSSAADHTEVIKDSKPTDDDIVDNSMGALKTNILSTDDTNAASFEPMDSDISPAADMSDKKLCVVPPKEDSGSDAEILEKKTPRSRKHSGSRRRMCCKYCNTVFTCKAERRSHMQAKHPDEIPVHHCTDCNYSSVEYKNYERHLLRHLIAGPFQCRLCSFSSTTQSSINRHVTLQHASSHSAKQTPDTSALDHSDDSGSLSPDITDPESFLAGDEEGKNTPGKVALADNPALAENGTKQKSVKRKKSEMITSSLPSDTDITSVVEQTPGADKEESASSLEVEVKYVPPEDGYEEGIWWTCLTCGARYNERAKVRRHVKNKHNVPMTECHLIDRRPPELRAIGTISNPTLGARLPDKDKTVKVELAVSKTEVLNGIGATSMAPTSATDIASDLSEEKGKSVSSNANKTDGKFTLTSTSSVATSLPRVVRLVPLHLKTILRPLMPKPLQFDANLAMQAVKATELIKSKQQVVLPKRDWKKVPVPLKPKILPKPPVAGKMDALVSKDTPESEEPFSSADKHATPPDDTVRNVVKEKRKLILCRKSSDQSIPLSKKAKTDESATAQKQTDGDSSLDCLSTECSKGAEMKSLHDVKEDGSGQGQLAEHNVTSSEPPEIPIRVPGNQTAGIKRTSSSLKCAHCSFIAFKLPDLRKHLLEHMNEKSYVCNICSRTFKNDLGLFLHEQRKHKLDAPGRTFRESKLQQGPVLEGSSTNSAEVSQKLSEGKVVGRKRRKKCSVAPSYEMKQFIENMEVSLKSNDISENPDASNDSHGLTDQDNKTIDDSKRSDQTGTKTIVVQSNGDSEHVKIVIRRQSKTLEDILKEHVQSSNSRMMCRFCGYVAKVSTQLAQHMMIHTGERNYQCPISDCNYDTIWKCDMKRHFRKFHPEEVERNGGSYPQLLKKSYHPTTQKGDVEKSSEAPDSENPDDSSEKKKVTQIKMSSRQWRRLIKLRELQLSKTSAQDGAAKENVDSPTFPETSDQPAAELGDEIIAQKKEETMREASSLERFRPYKCSDCGRRSNWRWDIKKHIEARHPTAMIVKLNPDVARATFSDIFSFSDIRNGKIRIRSTRTPGLASKKRDAKDQGTDGSEAGKSQASNAKPESEASKPMSELEKTLLGAPAPVKSIGMIDMLRLRRFQCSGCPYRSNHRGDLGRHIRIRHGRGTCTISVLSADIAAATLHSFRAQWNRRKGCLIKEEQNNSARKEPNTSGRNTPDSGTADENLSRKQYNRESFFGDEGGDSEKCCDICPFRTDRSGLLELHKLRHRAPTKNSASTAVTYSCPHCPYFVRTSRQLERHMALHEGVPERKEPLLDIGGLHPSHGVTQNRYVCERCPFVCSVRNEFWLHRRLHFMPKVEVSYSCDRCPYWVNDRRTMFEHSGLHNQSYYPRLMVKTISKYSVAPEEASAKETGTSQKSETNTSNDDTVREMDVHAPDGENITHFNDAAEEDPTSPKSEDGKPFPVLEIIGEWAVEPLPCDQDANDICPLLEVEADQPSAVVSEEESEEAVPCPTLVAELPVDNPTKSEDADNLATSLSPAETGGTFPVFPNLEAEQQKLRPEEIVSVPDQKDICSCTLQCPYCFFQIASVRLLRQHMVFHVAVADASRNPIFNPDLDSVEDGRMDDSRCSELVRLCDLCRRIAERENPVVSDVTESDQELTFFSLLSLHSLQ